MEGLERTHTEENRNNKNHKKCETYFNFSKIILLVHNAR